MLPQTFLRAELVVVVGTFRNPSYLISCLLAFILTHGILSIVRTFQSKKRGTVGQMINPVYHSRSKAVHEWELLIQTLVLRDREERPGENICPPLILYIQYI